jgi:hypothetical protein
VTLRDNFYPSLYIFVNKVMASFTDDPFLEKFSTTKYEIRFSDSKKVKWTKRNQIEALFTRVYPSCARIKTVLANFVSGLKGSPFFKNPNLRQITVVRIVIEFWNRIEDENTVITNSAAKKTLL